jgi:hypothetical protein
MKEFTPVNVRFAKNLSYAAGGKKENRWRIANSLTPLE